MLGRKTMKFLICGLGSIGQRHYSNLKVLGENDVVVYRTGKGTAAFVEKFIEEFRPTVFNDFSLALRGKPDVVLITNPTAYHVSVALEAAQSDCHLFIEKPLSHTFDGIEKLLREVEQRDLVTYVAYNLRFSSPLQDLKRHLESGEFGRVISFHAEMAERIIDWHPWEDYRTSYASRKDLGGGVILTQSHEVDYLYWLFGPVKEVVAFGGKLSDLKIDVEDVAKILFRFDSGIVGSLDIDYLKKPPKRGLEIVTTLGRINWDYFAGEIGFTPIQSKDSLIKKNYINDRNVTFLAELESFIACVRQGQNTVNRLSEGIEVLKIALSIKQSLGENKIISVL